MMIRTLPSSSISQVVRDYLALTKPRIVALLVFTTLVALVVARSAVSLQIIVATVIGGTLSAAGASALNQYYDRDIDGQMSRTKNRPLPAGRISPINALLFGLGLIIWSTFIFITWVNWLSALLALLGAVYYLLIYTHLLKRNTAMNIIIGGGAGAMPVLVGWAAATGQLSLYPFILFAIVFLWTPPHSWALAVLVNSDYERAHVPMMPVAYGLETARVQIVWYSLQLVILTLLPLPLRMFSAFYFIVAIGLGAGLLLRSTFLLQNMTKLAARQLYKYSSLYLLLLFLAMMLDRIIFKT
jgi:protoheme IX farnesyltransferase